MFAWLFGFKSLPVVNKKDLKFSEIPVGQSFKKMDGWDEVTYVKTSEKDYETPENSYHCTKWYHVNEDFTVTI